MSGRVSAASLDNKTIHVKPSVPLAVIGEPA
jgi:hypothetical protein